MVGHENLLQRHRPGNARIQRLSGNSGFKRRSDSGARHDPDVGYGRRFGGVHSAEKTSVVIEQLLRRSVAFRRHTCVNRSDGPPRWGQALKIIFDPAIPHFLQLIAGVTFAASLVVIALGVHAAPFRNRQRILDAVARYQLAILSRAIERYKQDCNAYPPEQEGLSRLITNPGAPCWKGPYLGVIPHDPWGRPFKYVLPPNSVEPYVLSYGADGMAGGEFFDQDLSSRDSNRPIPETPNEAQVRRIYRCSWLGAWTTLVGCLYVYSRASRSLKERSASSDTNTAAG
jgi:general secretion pathway protein G